MKKLFLCLITTLLLFAGCSSNNEESKQEEPKKMDPHTPEEVQNLFVDYGFDESNISGSAIYKIKDENVVYQFMFMPSPAEGGYSFAFNYDEFSYMETHEAAFISVDVSDEISCKYDVKAEKLKDGQDSSCDESVTKDAKEVAKKLDDFLNEIGISKEDLVNFAKQCSVDYYNSKNQNNNSSFDIEKESNGQFTTDTINDLTYVIGSDWYLSESEKDRKTYAYFTEDGKDIIFVFTASYRENENKTQADELYEFISNANSIDSVVSSGITYENQKMITTENGLKIIRYTMISSENTKIYVAADIVTDEYQYTLSMVGENYLKDNLNELFDSLVSFTTLTK